MQRLFSTPPSFAAPSGAVDRDQGSIRGVTIAQLGLAKGHGGWIDKTFLLQIVENAATKPAGVKARFGHPNMCSSAMGTYLGRFKNYSYTGDQVKADLFLDETARKTPGGDIYSYVFDMAEKNPDMFGASIVFTTAESEIIEEEIDNQKVKREYFRLSDLMATDLVDSPAATDSLFSANTFPGIATQFLDENPDLLEIIFSKPDSVVEFLSNYLNNSSMNISEKIRENFAAFLAAFSAQPPAGGIVPAPAPQDETLNTLFSAFCAAYPESFTNVEDFSQEQKAESITAFLESLSSQNSVLTESFDALQSELETKNKELESFTLELETRYQEIANLRQQLSARPSIPLNVTDPSIHISNTDKDETGKKLLSQMPKDYRRKLKQT